MLEQSFETVPEFAASLGIALGAGDKFEVHSLRRSMRVRTDGRVAPQVMVSLAQRRKPVDRSDFPFRGGSTLVVDLTKPELPTYVIVKRIDNRVRNEAANAFASQIDEDPLRRLFFNATEPFAALHQLAEHGEQDFR